MILLRILNMIGAQAELEDAHPTLQKPQSEKASTQFCTFSPIIIILHQASGFSKRKRRWGRTQNTGTDTSLTPRRRNSKTLVVMGIQRCTPEGKFTIYCWDSGRTGKICRPGFMLGRAGSDCRVSAEGACWKREADLDSLVEASMPRIASRA